MKIEVKKVTVRDVAENYRDNNEEGVVGYDGKLNIRPKYQREFIYNVKQRDAVLSTIRKGFPLNVMYWAVNDDGTYEVLDGQQRTISFCQYAAGDFSINVDGHPMAIHNLTQPQRDQILDYELMVYVCDGNDQDKLDWFRTINIAGGWLTMCRPASRADEHWRGLLRCPPSLVRSVSANPRTRNAARRLCESLRC